MMLWSAVTLAVLGGLVVADDQVCFEPLGCFSMTDPWWSALRPLPAPMAPEEVSTKVKLFTKQTPDKAFWVTMRPEVSIQNSTFNPEDTTIFITHGFSSNGNASWQVEMKDAILNKMDANVFITDWGKGAALLNYFQVASNTRLVAAELTRLVNHLLTTQGVKPADIHLIGHSLGAQISSYVGKAVNGIGRITALDPAQPGFEGFNRQVRLDSSDATYVDVIHSDAKPLIPFLGFGMLGSYGDTDYYLNGGADQPGCIIPENPLNITSFLDLAKVPVEVISNIVTCPHSRSYRVYTASIKYSNCTFWGHPRTLISTSAAILTHGQLGKHLLLSDEDCTIKSCSPLGLESITYPARGDFNVGTSGDNPFCVGEPDVDRKMARDLDNFTKNKGSESKKPWLGIPIVKDVLSGSVPSIPDPKIPSQFPSPNLFGR